VVVVHLAQLRGDHRVILRHPVTSTPRRPVLWWPNRRHVTSLYVPWAPWREATVPDGGGSSLDTYATCSWTARARGAAVRARDTCGRKVGEDRWTITTLRCACT
jgi:hypothetical protein